MTDAGKFVAFAQSLKGDEKQEAQTFLNHFFQVFGYEDVFTAGGLFEARIKPSDASTKPICSAGAFRRPYRNEREKRKVP